MVKRGLKNNIDLIDANIAFGTSLQKAQANLFNTEEGKRITHEAKMLTKILSDAISQGDVQQLFTLEHIAIKRDMECFGVTERRTSAMALIVDAAHRFEETATPDGAKKFLEEVGGGTLPSKIPSTDMVRNAIKNLKAQIKEQIDNTQSPALKLYLSRRRDALDFIRKEYIKNLEAGLGKTPQRQRGMGRTP